MYPFVVIRVKLNDISKKKVQPAVASPNHPHYRLYVFYLMYIVIIFFFINNTNSAYLLTFSNVFLICSYFICFSNKFFLIINFVDVVKPFLFYFKPNFMCGRVQQTTVEKKWSNYNFCFFCYLLFG